MHVPMWSMTSFLEPATSASSSSSESPERRTCVREWLPISHPSADRSESCCPGQRLQLAARRARAFAEPRHRPARARRLESGRTRLRASPGSRRIGSAARGHHGSERVVERDRDAWLLRASVAASRERDADKAALGQLVQLQLERSRIDRARCSASVGVTEWYATARTSLMTDRPMTALAA